MAQTYGMKYRQGPPGAVWLLLVVALAGVMISGPENEKPEMGGQAEPVLSAMVLREAAQQEDRVNVYDPSTDSLLEMNLEEYIIHVVAAEMPAGYEIEALKAQAVAARTLTVRNRKNGGCSAREGADVCADHGHCQAYCSDEAMEKKWGEKAAEYRKKIKEAVYATAGEILHYGGEIIEVFYHAQSAGVTEELAHVFSGSRPYLVSVASAESVKTVEERLKAKTLAEKINQAYPKAKLEADKLAEQIAVEKQYDSGRAAAVRMGDAVLTGVQVRRALGLRSAQFTVHTEGDEVVFTTFGYGHGVGMSQAGAQAMAAAGSNYREILAHYYPGTSLEQSS